MFIILQFDIFKFARVVEIVKIVDFGVEPEGWGFWQGAGFDRFVVASDLLSDAVYLILVDVGVVSDESELAGFGADGMGDKVAKCGILHDIKR